MQKDVQKNFRLFRMYDKNHIICDAPLKYRQAYYSALKNLTEKACNIPSYKAFFKSLKQLFSLSDDHTQQAADKVFLILNKVYRKRKAGFLGLFKKPEYSHKYIYNLIVEAGYINALLTEFHIDSWLISIAEQFKLNENELARFQEYLSILLSGNTELLLKQTDTEIKFLRETISQTTKHIISEQEYEKLPVYNIAVVAVMSAGKSTFINALLGNEIFPEANAACTAKITSIYDNDTFERIAGITIKDGKIQKTLNIVSNEKLKNWNNDINIDRIILEGNLDNISSKNKIVAIHDTPGTNFSGDETHREITINFLENTKLDTLICILNAKYINTIDFLNILKDIKKIETKHKDLKILFVLNKIDAFDLQQESVEKALSNVINSLNKEGFKNMSLIPTSARAARLFKMALSDKYDKFTEDESDDFKVLFRKFHKTCILEPIGILEDNIFELKNNDGEKITIDGQKYCLSEIEAALYNTYFNLIEKIINNKITTYIGGKND